MNSIHPTGGNLFRALGTAFSHLLSFPPRLVRAAGKSLLGPMAAPACLSHAMHSGKHLQVNPATEERCLSGLTKSEVEELLDWIESYGFHLLEVSYQEETGFVVRWDVR
jgi:hypothetical protein